MKSPDPKWWKEQRILVTGADGFIGSRVLGLLGDLGLGRPGNIRQYSLPDGDLRSASDARWAVRGSDVVLHLAADVGGAGYSEKHAADQYRNCSAIDLAVLEAAREAGATRVVILSCAAAYPASAASPRVESAMFDGPPSDSQLGYGLAKRNGLSLAMLYTRQYGISMSGVVAGQAYGPGDHFDDTAQIVASTIRQCSSAAGALDVAGDGSAVHDFVYVDDVVRGVLLAAEHLAPGTFANVGSGVETSERTLVELIVELTGYKGSVRFIGKKTTDGSRQSLDISKASRELGYEPQTALRDGLEKTIEWHRRNVRM